MWSQYVEVRVIFIDHIYLCQPNTQQIKTIYRYLGNSELSIGVMLSKL